MRAGLVAIVLAAAVALPASAGPSGSPCPRDARLGSVAFVRGGALHVLSFADCHDRVLVARGVSAPVRFSRYGRSIAYGNRWRVSVAGGRPGRVTPSAGLPSPDGRLVAEVRARRRPRAPSGTQAIWVVDRRGRGRAVHTVHESYRGVPAGSPGPLGLVTWSPDSRWLLFYIDPVGSASLAADGIAVQAIGVQGGRPRRVVRMLLYRDYLAWCGRRLVVTAGGSRLATEHKWLAVAAAPDWRARRLVRARGQAWGSVSCWGREELAVQSQPVSHDYNFTHTRWSIWLVRLDGSRRRLTAPPPGFADDSPRWVGDGRALLFVRARRGAGSLYAWQGGRVVGPIVSLGVNLGYYGHRDWWYGADWARHRAKPR